ncbi:Endonuclease/exonuclease/phosphatase [Xylaria scruposa]|nr:Endonuclease/exonuclease/phosphatase [Xylaria scruposa]
MSAPDMADTVTTSLDVFILTFNAAKEQINPHVFASHLRNAFAQNATGLPELIVICLQEMAPLAQSFIGSYMIDPFFQNYASAVHIAASSHVAHKPVQSPDVDQEGYQDEPNETPYTLVTTRNVGMTGIMLFALTPSALQDLKSTEVSFGAGDMANKGAVALRMFFSKQDAGDRKRQTELTFVSTHLAPHEWNLEKRNKNWETIVSGLLFEDPQELCGIKTKHPTPRASTNDSDDEDEGEGLLSHDLNERALHDITVYKPGSHLFVAGDLNYRISKTSPNDKSVFPDLDPDSPNHYKRFLPLDQLTSERVAGRTLHGLRESAILFPPTYKLKITEKQAPQGTQNQRNGDSTAHDVVDWKWSSHRWPGWCDRVLYLDVPRWVSPSSATTEIGIDTIAYDALPAVRTSDHRAVFLRLKVPVLEPSILAPPQDLSTSDSNDDPRVKLPYPVDFDSWANRARFKKWESVIGWSMLISQSKQGIAVFATLLLVGLGTWWLKSM